MVGVVSPRKEEGRRKKALQVVKRAYRRAERLKAMCAVRIKSSLTQKRGC